MNSRDQKLGLLQPLRPAQVEEGMLRVSILAELPPVLQEMGHDPAALLKAVGLPSSLLDDPEKTLSFQTVSALMESAVERTGCPHLGLLVGQRGGVNTPGVVGLLMRHSPTVGVALQNLFNYVYLHDRGSALTLSLDGRSSSLGYAIFGKDLPASDQICAGGIAVACGMMRDLCGADWQPSEVRLPFRKPNDTAPYRMFFRAPLRFGADHAAMTFPATWLDHPVPGADSKLLRTIEGLVAELVGADGGKIAGHVRRAALSLLLSGSVCESDIARVFAMHRRTLGRRLQGEGTSFQEVLKEVRFEVACQLLRDTDSSVEDIATTLGYAGASPFGRAFRQWSELTPVQWRNGNAPRPARK